MKRPKHGATLKQYAYATKLLSADGPTKSAIARSVGYSPSVAANTENKIEKTEGFKNAVIELAHKSNNLVLAIMAEYERRGFTDFSNTELNNAVGQIGAAWDRFNKHRADPKNLTAEGNPLRKVFMQKVENQTIHITPEQPAPPKEPIPAEATEVEPDLDF